MRLLHPRSRHLALLVVATVGLLSAVPPASGAEPVVRCDGRVATIVGTDGPDRLVGTNKADVIVAGAGDDVVTGGNGEDVVCGGPGADTLSGGNGGDRLFGEDGDDRLTGDNGDDTLHAGAGTDRADGSNGRDRCEASETTTSCEVVVAPVAALSPSLAVLDGCAPGLSVDGVSTPDVVTNGRTVGYDVTVRNDPTGTCRASGAAVTTVSGTFHVDSSLASLVSLDDTAMWLEVPGETSATRTVLPAAAGLATDGSTTVAGCPGGVAEGCAATVGATVGYVSYPGGSELTVPAGGALDVPFRFFPRLDAADLVTIDAAAGHVTVAFAARASTGELLVVRSPGTFAEPVATGDITVTATLPTGTVSATVPEVVAGDQVTTEGLFSFVVEPTHPDRVAVDLTASAAGVTSPSVTVETLVVADTTDRSPLQPAVWPSSAAVGAGTTFTVSVSPVGELAGPVTVGWPDGNAVAVDDGTGGDSVADDGVWSARFAWTPGSEGTATISATGTVDGALVSGSVALPVRPAGFPTGPEHLAALNVVSSGASSFLADRLVLITADDADPSAVRAVAEAVGGELVGVVGPGAWQLAIPAVADRAGLDAVFAAVSAFPVVLGAEPSFVGELDDVVQPDDPWFALQDGVQIHRLDDAWALQRGTQRTTLVAVIDSGVNLDHPDLAGKISSNGIDIRDGDDNPNDDTCLHGTHVAGIVGAKADNAEGVAGVNWGARILPVKVFHPGADCGQFRYDDIAAGIDYAVSQGAAVLNMSLSGPDRSEVVAQALDRALEANRVAVATAGNTGKEERRYPSGFGRSERYTSFLGFNERTYDIDILSVANVDDHRNRAASSTFGPWVDVAGPGQNVMSTTGDLTQYETKSGTSMAAPFIAGLASLIRSEDPTATPADVRSRLVLTGFDRDPSIGRVVDAYGAVVNGGFESGLRPWRTTGTVSSVSRLGSIKPIVGKKMLSLSTGPAGPAVRASVTRRVSVPADALRRNQLRVAMYYNFVSEEYPEYVQQGFNDTFTVELVLPDGSRERLVDESVDTTAWTPVSGVDFPYGDTTSGQSGWRYVSVLLDPARLRGATTFEIVVQDQGDDVYDSVALIDGVEVS
ncbi:S8 family serine peptidase [Cellulomonas sp. Leaf334]|uniref:S8 family serine peptidase n=1 Tax=Cellulomonas sp. Leaf334 TaxID=1736339 RepID=UPI0006FA7422|nr:S8 family serine peptidase [Cellulomonas sp. Leaf334]KQR11723.1 hypothetical protein ASF78_10825 [Cellulomonas sp. Leaf334]